MRSGVIRYRTLDNGATVDFRLTYAGPLLAHRDDRRLAERSLHVHNIRKEFQKQLRMLWREHPTLVEHAQGKMRDGQSPMPILAHDGFNWMPLVHLEWGLICKIELLMLRKGRPGTALYDLDNRLKTVFDALRKAKNPNELGAGTSAGQQTPGADEDPFYVLLEDDSVITHVAVTTDTLLEPVPDVPEDIAARIIVGVTIRPYKSSMRNLDFIS